MISDKALDFTAHMLPINNKRTEMKIFAFSVLLWWTKKEENPNFATIAAKE